MPLPTVTNLDPRTTANNYRHTSLATTDHHLPVPAGPNQHIPPHTSNYNHRASQKTINQHRTTPMGHAQQIPPCAHMRPHTNSCTTTITNNPWKRPVLISRGVQDLVHMDKVYLGEAPCTHMPKAHSSSLLQQVMSWAQSWHGA